MQLSERYVIYRNIALNKHRFIMRKPMLKMSLTSLLAISAVFGLSGVSQAVNAATVNITWEDPESYRDVRATNESRKRFRERTFAKLDAYFTELAESLPEEQTLTITVTNLDLAGQVWPASFTGLGFGANDVRVIDRIDIPRMTLSYSLSDESGETMSAKDVDIKDMGFMDRGIRRQRNEPLSYEKAMIKEWFDDTFLTAQQ